MKKMFKIVFLTVIIIFILCVIAVAVFAAKLFNAPKSTVPGFTVTAHSGSEHTQDNSMEFLKKGIEIDAQVLEIDVTFRADGTPVLLHKEEAEANEGLLFEQAIKYISENSETVKLNLDLKSTAFLPGAVEIIEKYGMKERCFFTGVNEEDVEVVRRDGGGIPYYLNLSLARGKRTDKNELEAALKKVKDSGAIGINCNYKNASPEMVALFHENGLLVSYWTANDKLVMHYLLSLSPDNITTRYPVALKKITE